MNNVRRKAIEEIIARLDEQRSTLEGVLNEEQEAYDILPEMFKFSERGETMLENVDSLSDVSCNLDELISDLQNIIDR